MTKIIKLTELKPLISFLSFLRKNHKKTVLVGGCFDILHIGHTKFLEKAKKLGDLLIILLESDEKVKKLKGTNRPIFKQQERATVLSALKDVDYIILLSSINKNQYYNQIVRQLKPDIIAVTENDPFFVQKKLQAESVNGKIKIIPIHKTFSSSKLIKLLGID